MSGPPPPPGQPWLANIGNNPNINRDPPPPPIGVGAPPPAVAVAPASAPAQQVIVEERHHQPAIGVGLGVPAMGLGVNVVPPPIGIGPAFGPFGIDGMGPPWMGGPLQPQRPPWNIPGINGTPMYPGLGLGLGAQFPPPPPGIPLVGGGIPAFAPGIPLWANDGVGVAGVGLGAVGVGGMGMMGMGFGNIRPPAPHYIDGFQGAPAQPDQGDITQVPGGCPPGATHVEAPEHTLVHLLKGGVLPWEVPGQQHLVEILHLASTTGINRLIQVSAIANNLDGGNCEGLAVTECLEMGNGFWEKGKTFVFDDAVSKVLTMKDAGWDNQRNRVGGQSLHIYLHKATMGGAGF